MSSAPARTPRLHTLDLAVVGLYFAFTLGVGLWVSRHQQSAADYFLGARDLPAWAILLSIVATETSALTVISIPGILLTLIAITLWSPSVISVATFIGLTHWVWQARTARSKILSLREEPFIVAARVSGASDLRIILRHIVPNILTTILVVMTTQIGYMIIVESSLSFFGMTGSTISWASSMMSTGRLSEASI